MHVPEGEEPNVAERLTRYWWLVGLLALIAWFALLWFMFGDVL